MNGKKYGCIGKTLKHSFSKSIHDILTPDAGYTLIELPDEKSLDEFMRRRDFAGINVTIPYKRAVIPYLDYISDEAKKIGAVNTIVNKNGRLCGYNTDFAGLSALIKSLYPDVSGKKALICGTGGTSLTAKAVLQSMNAAAVYRLSRTPDGESDIIGYNEAYEKHSDAEIIVNTTPAGMFPDNSSVPIRLSGFKGLLCAADAVYNPLRTRFVAEAAGLGAKSGGGLYMLVSQAVFSSELFFEKRYPENTAEEITRRLTAEKENIVLIGLPSCGKSVIGQKLARLLSRPFEDTDRLIEQAAGMSIPEIFEKQGEAAFRELESRIIKDCSMKTGGVIATGGGAVLRDENVDFLKQNGRLIFLDRALTNLTPSADRPLARDAGAIRALSIKRRPIYLKAADITLELENDMDRAAQDIIKLLYEGGSVI